MKALPVIVVLGWGLALAGCGGSPYTEGEVYDAVSGCFSEAFGASLNGGDEDEAKMDCLRRALPEFTDDQLNRLPLLGEMTDWEGSSEPAEVPGE